MKKLYSIILLVSFLTGVLQPILPMMEYELYEGNVAELFSGSESIGAHLADHFNEGLQNCVNKQADAQDDQQDPLLLDDDYYPIAIDLTTLPAPQGFHNGAKLYLPRAENTTDPTFLPNPPPPRMS